MERMTRRGQAPVKKELVEASMSAFVFWDGDDRHRYMLVANSGWSLPLFPHMLLLLLVFAVGSVFSTASFFLTAARYLHTRGRRDPGNLDDYPSCAHISPRCMSKKIDDERESALIKIPLDLHGFLNLAPWGERAGWRRCAYPTCRQSGKPRLWEHGERRGSTKGSVLQNDAIFKNDTTCSDHIT